MVVSQLLLLHVVHQLVNVVSMHGLGVDQAKGGNTHYYSN